MLRGKYSTLYSYDAEHGGRLWLRGTPGFPLDVLRHVPASTRFLHEKLWRQGSAVHAPSNLYVGRNSTLASVSSVNAAPSLQPQPTLHVISETRHKLHILSLECIDPGSGDMVWRRRMPWCFYPRKPVLRMGIFVSRFWF